MSNPMSHLNLTHQQQHHPSPSNLYDPQYQRASQYSTAADQQLTTAYAGLAGLGEDLGLGSDTFASYSDFATLSCDSSGGRPTVSILQPYQTSQVASQHQPTHALQAMIHQYDGTPYSTSGYGSITGGQLAAAESYQVVTSGASPLTRYTTLTTTGMTAQSGSGSGNSSSGMLHHYDPNIGLQYNEQQFQLAAAHHHHHNVASGDSQHYGSVAYKSHQQHPSQASQQSSQHHVIAAGQQQQQYSTILGNIKVSITSCCVGVKSSRKTVT